MGWLSFTSNPIWRARQSFLHIGPANAPTAWDFDQNGYVSPSGGRQMTAEESQWVQGYNSEWAALNEANREFVNGVLARFSPTGDVNYVMLSDADTLAGLEDMSWLYDHDQGSAFYNDGSNYQFASDPDAEADIRLGRMIRYLDQACLAVDYSDVSNKVSSGISSPIVIDLNGDGIETTSFLAGPTVLFDINGDGQKERTAWLAGNDAFLAIDKNGNGVIDGVNELFGGQNRGDGFANLASYDSNGDNVIDQNDEVFSQLLLWQDSNVDGITDAGELQNASTAGLQSISTSYASQEVTQNGNLLGEVSSAIFQGEEVDAIDVYFRYRQDSETTVSSKIAPTINPLISAMSSFATTPVGDALQGSLNNSYSSNQLAMINMANPVS